MANVTDPRVRRFFDALDKVVGLHVDACETEVSYGANAGQPRVDFVVRVRLGTEKQGTVLLIEAKESIYPRDAQRLLERFTSQAQHSPANGEVPVVVATQLSEAAKNLLRDGHLNFFEANSGTLFYRHGHRHIDIQRQGNELAERKIRSIFSGAREQVVHALLEHWRREGSEAWVSGAELAQLAGTSTFTVSTTMQELERQAWVDVTGAGPTLRRRLSRPERLLDAWADVWKQRLPKERRTRWYAYANGPGGIVDLVLERLADRDGWAISGAAAANSVVPHLTIVDRVSIIVPPGTGDEWAAALKFEPAEKGANITFVERTGASLMFGTDHPNRPGSRFASRFVMYLDLLDGVGRNKELAAEFRSRALKLGEMTNG